jgi:hypothetical protein
MNRLFLYSYKEIIAFYCKKSYETQGYSLCKKKVEIVNVKVGGAYSYACV